MSDMDFNPFEYLTVKFLDAATGIAIKSTISLIHSSPLSARSPDLCMLWHPGYRKRHSLRLFVESTASLVAAFFTHHFLQFQYMVFYMYHQEFPNRT